MPTLLPEIAQDFRYALRQMRKAPSFALTAVLTLSLGVGVATAIFSVVDAVILRPLPYDHPERIVVPQAIAREGYPHPFSYPDFKDLRAQNHTFAALSGIWDFRSVNMETPSGPVALRSVESSDNFFDVFGVPPMLGRTFRSGEDQPGKNDVAVLSYEVWEGNFGAQPDIIGQTIRLDGKAYTCVGVMPAGFRYPLSVQHAIYVPLHSNQLWMDKRGDHWLRAVGRLKPGVAPQQAQADLDSIMANLSHDYPDTDAGGRIQLIRLSASVNGDVSPALWTLSAAVFAVLLIGCVNIAGLLLARGVKREREVALRAAVGASRGRLVRQILTESLVIAAFGAAGGVALSTLLLAAMRTFIVHSMARGADVRVNALVLAAALVISTLVSVAASLAPAVRFSGADPNRALKTGGSAGTTRGHHRLRSVFIVSQVALSLVLLAVAGVLLRTVAEYRNADLGFDPRHILAAEIDLSPARYEGRDVWADFYQPLLDRVAHIPGVQSAGLIPVVPIQNWGWNSDIHITGQPSYPSNEPMLAEIRLVSPGYFDAMGIRLVRGRMLSPSIDVPTNKAGAMVVNQAFVKKFIPSGVDPIGQHIDDSEKPNEKTVIAGVVTDIRQNLTAPPMPEYDFLESALPPKYRAELLMQNHLVVRTAGDPGAVISSLRNAFHEVDPTLPFRTPETMDEIISDQLVMQRLESWLFGIFASLAVLLAIVGLYGLISHEVELGSRDIGIRMALGSTRERVLAMVLRRVAILLAVGIAAGLVLTFAARKLVASVAVIHFTHQAGLLAMLALALGLAGMLAALIPARRAASVQPIQALRTE
jgi:putative ABC transport system permease protein